MMKFWLLLVYTGLSTSGFAQRLATLEVTLPRSNHQQSAPVQVNLAGLTSLSDSNLSLVEVRGNTRISVLYQIEKTKERILHWNVENTDTKTTKRTYELRLGVKVKTPPTVKTVDKNGTLQVQANGKDLLQYNYRTVYPPTGIDTAFKRSGFIHPLWSPRGQVLTRIQAPDHYHHYGIWNPWTHVLFEGDTVDFWNLKDRKGTVRFAGVVSKTNGPVFSEYQVKQEHVAFKKGGKEKVALNELQSVRVYQPGNADYYIADVTINLTCASASPVRLLTYRYGGFGWRATEKWNKDNSEILTSGGKTRKDADGSTARWCMVQGQLDNDYAGAVMMSAPTNYNHPEPLRVWPETQNGKGDVFVNYSPTKNKDWLLSPGQTYTLRYRLLVFNGRYTHEQAESSWQYFSQPPTVSVKRK
ncbi:PmoA family protein [Hymenobacter qilianensis]|nr:PmoA family protein [Hymenobacter qilianensis]